MVRCCHAFAPIPDSLQNARCGAESLISSSVRAGVLLPIVHGVEFDRIVDARKRAGRLPSKTGMVVTEILDQAAEMTVLINMIM